MTDKELMQQALDYVRFYNPEKDQEIRAKLHAALRERLAQPEQDVWQWEEIYKDNVLIERRMKRGPDCEWEPWHTPRREWVGLTEEECIAAIDEDFDFGLDNGNVSNVYVIRYARAIEAKLKEKNA